MQRRLVLVTIAVLGFLGVARPNAQPPTRSFEGYWMGIDPVDGGDSRRSIRRQADGTYALVGRDTVLTLCDDTDRGIATFEDGTTTGRDRMGTDNLTIRCFNTSASVVIKARYQLVDANTMLETLTLANGTPFATIVFHRISAPAPQPGNTFQGYWLGVDPTDGGDARRSFLTQSDGTVAMIGRDTVFTLCDHTDRGIGSFTDGITTGRNRLASDKLAIQCFNNGASVVLKARFELLDADTMVEIASLQDGTPVSTILLHRTSAD
jgi:hypothetical protein